MASSRAGRQAAEHGFAYHVQVLDRSLQIIDILAEADEELGPAELGERLSLHRSTVHRLLMMLEHHRLIRRNPREGKYGLGLRLFELGSRAVAQLKLTKRAEPFLQRLVEEAGETAHIAVLSGTHMLSIAYVEGPGVLRLRSAVGRQAPTHCTAVGKAVIAFHPDQALDQFVRGLSLTRYTKRTLLTRESLKSELLRIRERGFAIDDEELEEGLRCVAAPIRNYTGRVIAAMGIAGPVFRVRKAGLPRLASAIMAAARDLSIDLGYKSAGEPAGLSSSSLRKTRKMNVHSRRIRRNDRASSATADEVG
jgi:DNA-binding IclR family transcriptional regulator